MIRHTFCACIAALVCTSTSLSAGEAPKPAAGLDQLSLFEADRDCSGTDFTGPPGTGRATTGIVHGAKAAGGDWLYFTYDGTNVAAQSTPYHFAAFMGFDAARKVFVQVGVDNSGHGYQISTSAGWSGGTMTFEGSENVNGKPVLQRDNFIRKGGGELIHAGETQNTDGKWTKTDEETCVRRK